MKQLSRYSFKRKLNVMIDSSIGIISVSVNSQTQYTAEAAAAPPPCVHYKEFKGVFL